MYLKLMVLILMSMTFMMPLFETLLASVIILFMATLLISVLLGTLLTSWVSLILLLMYVTGLLVLFGYMVAMSPNFTSPILKKKMFVLLIPLVFMTNMTFKPFSMNFEVGISHFVTKMNSPMYWVMAILLLLALLMAVSLCYKSPKTLRSFQKC